MATKFTLLLSVFFTLSNLGISQKAETLTNADVLKMVEAGLTTETIVAVISTSPVQFSTDVDSILILKKEGVPEQIIQAMIGKKTGSLSAADSPSEQVQAKENPSANIEDKAPLIFIRASREGGPGEQTLPNSIPEIVRQLRAKALEEGIELRFTFSEENADLILVLDREAKFLGTEYTWMLLDAETASPVTSGKTQLFRNTVKDAVYAIDQYWSARGLQASRDADTGAEPATVWLYREKGGGFMQKLWSGNLKEPPVYCNGRELARMDNGRYIEVELAPGTYRFTSDDEEQPPVTITLERGQESFLRMNTTVNEKGHIEEVDSEEGRKEIQKTKPLSEKFIIDAERVVSREN